MSHLGILPLLSCFSLFFQVSLGQEGYVSYSNYVYTVYNPSTTPTTTPTPTPTYTPTTYGSDFSSYYADPQRGYYGGNYYGTYYGQTYSPPTPTPSPSDTDSSSSYFGSTGYHGDQYTGYYSGYYGAYTYYGPSVYDSYEGYVGYSTDYRSMFRYKYNRTDTYQAPYTQCVDDFDCSTIEECCAFNEKEGEDISSSFCRTIEDVKDLDMKGESIGIRAKCKFRYRIMVIIIVCVSVPMLTILILIISCCYCEVCPLYKNCRKDDSDQIKHQQLPVDDTHTPTKKEIDDMKDKNQVTPMMVIQKRDQSSLLPQETKDGKEEIKQTKK